MVQSVRADQGSGWGEGFGWVALHVKGALADKSSLGNG